MIHKFMKSYFHKPLLILTTFFAICFFNVYIVIASPLLNKKIETSDPKLKSQAMSALNKTMNPFIENRGQINGEVAYYINAGGGSIFLTRKGEMTFSFLKILKKRDADSYEKENTVRKQLVFKIIPDTCASLTNRINVKGETKAKGIVNYFTGPKENWTSAVPTFKTVSCSGIFDGTKITYRAGIGLIEDIYTVSPGKNPAKIRFKVEGATDLNLDEEGNLLVNIEGVVFTIRAPFAFQEVNGKRIDVPVSFNVKGLTYGFTLASYNTKSPLIIDPELLYSTFIGGTGGSDSYGPSDVSFISKS